MLSRSLTANKYFWHGVEISETEYNHIKEIIANRPTAPDGFGYHLTVDLEWELYELPIIEDEAIDPAELGRTYTESTTLRSEE